MRVLSALCLILLLLLPSVGAEGVYVTDELISTTPAGPVLYLASDEVPAGEATKSYLATSSGGVGYATQWDYVVTEAFVASGALTLTYYVACDDPVAVRPGSDNPANPVASARGALAKGGTVINQANLYELRTCDGPDDIWEAVFEIDGADTAFAPGEVLNIQLILWAPNGAPGTDAENLYVLAGDGFPSGLTGAGLPGGTAVVAGPEVVYGNVTEDILLVEHDWATSRNTTFVYNWTAPAGNITLDVGLAAAQGNASVTILDADGMELHNATYDSVTNETATLAGGANWTVTVAYTDFIGTLRLHAAMADDGPDGNETLPPEGNTTVPPGDDNGTADGNDSPGLPLVMLLGAFVALALRKR